MKALYLGFVSPDDQFAETLRCDRRMPVQTQRFGWNLLHALGLSHTVVDAVSVAPASDYPVNSRILFRRHEFVQHGVVGTMAGFVNLIGLKHWTRGRAIDIELLRRYKDRADRPDVVIVHGVNSALLAAGRRAADSWGVPRVVVLTDPPHGALSRAAPPSSLLRRINYRSVLRELDSYDGAVCLTEGLAREFLPGRPHLLLEGFADVRDRPSRQHALVPRGPFDVVYAGGISEEYGCLNLIDAVRESSGTWTLAMCGRGTAVEQVLQAAASEPRIRYLGLLEQGELASVYAEAKVLVNPRPAHPFTRLSFPSKLLEYLAQGRLVASTRLPGIPPEYWEHLIELPEEASAMSRTLDEVTQWDDEVVTAKQERALQFLEDSKSLEPQGRRVAEFLHRLVVANEK